MGFAFFLPSAAELCIGLDKDLLKSQNKNKKTEQNKTKKHKETVAEFIYLFIFKRMYVVRRPGEACL